MMPFNLRDLMPVSLPDNYPKELNSLFQNSTNLYDFMVNMMNFSESLSEEQKEFKEMLSYLHQSIFAPIYKAMEITGYGVEGITDKESFRESFINYHKKTYPHRNFHEQFTDMYCALELYGFVKGKPRKQKMMNLINDAKHAFFGAYCDIVVSKDADFLEKTKFIYDLFEIQVAVLDMNQYRDYLENSNYHSNLFNFYNELEGNFIESKIIQQQYNEEENCTLIRLKNVYLSYFNSLVFVSNANGKYYYLTKESNNYSSGTLIKEIKYVTNSLSELLGVDCNEKSLFDVSEIDNEGKWVAEFGIMKRWLLL
ncbi:MAG: hypothetical protein LBS08_01440 [Candidatus Symbiothrix sp.]|nr:hypothetical protein [Candidatus Symbiothrix sp.]